MLLSSLLVAGVALLQHVPIVDANVLQVDPKCQKNACLSAVQSNRHHSDHKEWLPGCTSFFRKTITPTPATKTITTGAQHTVTRTVTQTSRRTVKVTATVSRTRTVQATHAVTVTASADAAARMAERDADASSGKTCPTGPAKPSQLPAYASACHNTMAYSSACNCVHVPHLTTTLPRCTNTVTVSRKGTMTTTKTVHVSGTKTITVATRTQFATRTHTNQVTKTVSQPTVSSSPATCASLSAFSLNLNSLDGSIVNGGITKTTLLGSDLGILTQLLGGGTPETFKIDAQSNLLTTDNETVAVSGNLGTTLNTIPLGSSVLGQYTQPTCQLGPSPNCDQLSCDLGGGRNKFAYCNGVGGVGQGLSLVATLPALGNCKFVNVTAVAG